MEYCYDLLNQTFDLPALALEIAQRIKKQANCGIYECVISKATRNGYDIVIEFKTKDNEYLTAKFNLMKDYGVRTYLETLYAMGKSTFEELINDSNTYSVCLTREREIHVIGVVK